MQNLNSFEARMRCLEGATLVLDVCTATAQWHGPMISKSDLDLGHLGMMNGLLQWQVGSVEMHNLLIFLQCSLCRMFKIVCGCARDHIGN